MSIFKFKIKSKVLITGEKTLDTWNIVPFTITTTEKDRITAISYKEYFSQNVTQIYCEVDFSDNKRAEYGWIWKPQGGGYWAFKMYLRR